MTAGGPGSGRDPTGLARVVVVIPAGAPAAVLVRLAADLARRLDAGLRVVLQRDPRLAGLGLARGTRFVALAGGGPLDPEVAGRASLARVRRLLQAREAPWDLALRVEAAEVVLATEAAPEHLLVMPPPGATAWAWPEAGSLVRLSPGARLRPPVQVHLAPEEVEPVLGLTLPLVPAGPAALEVVVHGAAGPGLRAGVVQACTRAGQPRPRIRVASGPQVAARGTVVAGAGALAAAGEALASALRATPAAVVLVR